MELTGYLSSPNCCMQQTITACTIEWSSKAISYAVGFVSRKRKPKSGFLTQSKKGFFDSRLKFFRLRIPTGGSVEKLSRKSFTRVFSTDRIAHPTPNTHSHSHTATHPYQAPHCSIIQGTDAGVAITAVASRSKSAWRIPSFARQQRVSHDGSSARSQSHAANNGCGCCSFGGSRLSVLHERSFGGFWLSRKPPTRWDEGSPSRCSRRKREAQSCQPISTAVQQYSLTPTASRKSTKTIKSTRLTIRRRTRRIQSKKSLVEKGRFRLAESDCIRNGLRGIFGSQNQTGITGSTALTCALHAEGCCLPPRSRRSRASTTTCRKRRLSSSSTTTIRGCVFCLSYCCPGYLFIFIFAHFYFPASGQAVVTGVVPFPPPVFASIFYRAYNRVQ